MRKWVPLIVFSGVLLVLPACRPAAPAADVDQEKKSLSQLFEKYLESVKTADLALASQVWLNTPEASAVTPLGRFKGWEGVRNDLYVNFLQKAFSERELKADNLVVNVSGDTAWAVFDWTFTAKLANGQPFSSMGWESHVYRKIDGKWVIVHLHYSTPVPRQ